MDVAHLENLAELDDTYWWHVAKRRLVTKLLLQHAPPPGVLVEGGIGSSRNLRDFRDLGYDVHGFDLFEESTEYARRHGIETAVVHDLAEPWPVEAGSVNAVVLLDVIEHVPDPVRVLEHVRSSLADDGVAIVTVPAYPWLFGEWDERLGHHRRYTRPMLREQAELAGLRATWCSHWNSFTLPAAVAVRGWQRMFPKKQPAEFPEVSSLTNATLLRLAAAERAVMDRIGVPAGLSLVAVLAK